MKTRKNNPYTAHIIGGFIGLCVMFILSVLMVFSLLDVSQIKTTILFFFCIGAVLAGLTIFYWIKRENINADLYLDLTATLEAISRAQAVIEFKMDGTILNANEKMLTALGYEEDEVLGKHHRMFLDEKDTQSDQYQDFWDKLNRGEHVQGESKRIGKNNKIVWFLSSYNPILNREGKPVKIIKVAVDITKKKQQTIELEHLTNHLQDISTKISGNSKEISAGIEQLEATVSEQVTSAAQQASAVTDISTTIEEIKATTQQTLVKAKELGEAAKLTNKEGEKGKEAIGKMSDSMCILQEKMQQISTTILSLNDKTQQIGEITEAVADIAKQSKMLALNASIEAAKAGESGKGFAVVAGEVKDLAERSQQSTDRVQKILQDIRQTAERAVMVTEEGTKSVDENNQQVNLTGKIINSLGHVIEETSLALMQIVSAVREESVAIDQVDASIREINKVTSSFTIASEQTKNATLGLGKVVESLATAVESYDAKVSNTKD